jgi:DNA repair protein RadA/Sms
MAAAEFLPNVQSQYRCRQCTRLSSEWYPECPSCWQPLGLQVVARARSGGTSRSISLVESAVDDARKFPTNLPGLDMLLGGGWLERSVNLILGEPGAGKSTLMLMAACLGGEDAMYHSSEEQTGPITARAKRLSLPITAKTRLFATKTWEEVEDEIYAWRPRVVYVDSLQDTWVRSMPESARGGPTQQYYIVDRCEKLALKAEWPIAFVLISHVTKDGEFKGHNEIPHKVTAEFKFRISDRLAGVREFVPKKNRYGVTNQSAWFQMLESGNMIEIRDPKALNRERALQRYQPLTTTATGAIETLPGPLGTGPTPRRPVDDDDDE